MNSAEPITKTIPTILEQEKPIFAVVILHYLSSELTRKCVASLQALTTGDSSLKIVVVDNASPNGSGEELRKLYADYEDIRVLINEENLGFSVANNRGFEYAVNEWNPEAILVLNNDIQIVQETFFDTLQDALQRYEAYVISLDVYVPSKNTHQSPLKERPLDEAGIERTMAHYRGVIDGLREKTLRQKLKRFAVVRKLLETRDKWRQHKKERHYQVARMNVVPSGAALVFTRRFIETGELPFVPTTFLYYEEDILALRCERNGWGILYYPELQVLHMHEGATNEIAPTKKDKELFIAKHYYDSLCTLLEYRKQIEATDSIKSLGMTSHKAVEEQDDAL